MNANTLPPNLAPGKGLHRMRSIPSSLLFMLWLNTYELMLVLEDAAEAQEEEIEARRAGLGEREPELSAPR